MSTALLTYRPPSERVSVRPWAVEIHPNAEQLRGRKKAERAERKAQAKREREQWHDFSVAVKYTRLSDNAQFLSAFVFNHQGNADAKTLRPAMRRDFEAFDKLRNGPIRVTSLAWMEITPGVLKGAL